jgi:ribonuclease R
LEDASVDEKISLALYDKDEHFSRQAENEAASWGGEVHREMYPHRADLRDLAFCTIDPNEAKDFDDAVYYDEPNHTLYVAIADVSEYVFAFGALDKEAMKRGFSIYFPHKSIPMLPRALSENLCSLKPDEDRLAFGFKIKLNPHTWEVEHEHIWEGIIRSHKRYTYDEIDRFLAEAHAPRDSRDELILPHLLALYEVTKKLRAKRLQDAFTFHTAEIRMHLDERERITSTTVEQETASHQLIEECMLLANCAAAKRESKGIFRTHEEPGIEKIERLIEDLALIGLEAEYSPDLPRLIRDLQRKADEMGIRADVDKLIIRAQKQARYTAQNIGHFGLGFARYTHFTSPIRRYSDLVLHRLLKAELRGEEGQLRYQLEHIDELCEDLSDLEREADRVAWDYMDRKFARWADERIGQEVRCKVTELGRTAVLTLDDELVGARLFAPDIGLELFEHVWARIESVDLATTRIGAKVTRRESV